MNQTMSMEPQPDDPRLTQHATDYDPERGGWYPPEPTTEES